CANIDWNPNSWRGLPKDRASSGFGYVAAGGIPAESWNLDFGNSRNSSRSIYGYVKAVENAAADVTTVFLTSMTPQKERFVVGLYGRATVMRSGPSWKPADRPRRDGSNGYANLKVSRDLAAACAHSRLVPWDIERHYGRSYG